MSGFSGKTCTWWYFIWSFSLPIYIKHVLQSSCLHIHYYFWLNLDDARCELQDDIKEHSKLYFLTRALNQLLFYFFRTMLFICHNLGPKLITSMTWMLSWYFSTIPKWTFSHLLFFSVLFIWDWIETRLDWNKSCLIFCHATQLWKGHILLKLQFCDIP